MQGALLIFKLTLWRLGFWTAPAFNQNSNSILTRLFLADDSITEKSRFIKVKASFFSPKCRAFHTVLTFFYVTLTTDASHTQTSRHSDRRLQRKTDYTQANEMEEERPHLSKKPGNVLSKYFIISCLKVCQLSCLTWCLFMSVERKRHALCLKLPSVISAHELTVTNFMSHRFLYGTCGNKRLHFPVSSTLTSVNIITIDSKCLCSKILQMGFC